MAGVAHYRHMALSDLQSLVMEPLLRDKIAMARQVDPEVLKTMGRTAPPPEASAG
jgi:hypothetical protein